LDGPIRGGLSRFKEEQQEHKETQSDDLDAHYPEPCGEIHGSGQITRPGLITLPVSDATRHILIAWLSEKEYLVKGGKGLAKEK
jgi:hypothetical protein